MSLETDPTRVPAQVKETGMGAWWMVPDNARANGFSFEYAQTALPEPGPGEALVEIVGCGVCGTDLSYYSGKVPTANPPPIVLGHEISGRVVRGQSLQSQAVIVPTVVPCRKCELCKSGRANRCFKQKMYGSNYGSRGGFATHVLVPERELTPVPDSSTIPLPMLSVVADAISTPYQAVKRAQVTKGSRVVIIGATGGLGIHAAQWCKAAGAELVIGIARDEARLKEVDGVYYDAVISSRDKTDDAVRHAVWAAARAHKVNPRINWTIFEASGTLGGQNLGLALTVAASKLVLVGFAAGEITYPLSKIMANDSEIIGTWGCDPAEYGHVLNAALAHKIALSPLVELRPLAQIQQTFDALLAGERSLRRIVLQP